MYVNMMNYTNVSDLWIECNAQSAFIFCQNKFNFSDLWWFSAGDKQVWKKEPLPFPYLLMRLSLFLSFISIRPATVA